MKTVAIIPAYNEEMRIGNAIRDVSNFVDDVIVIDDCSSDKTFEKVCNLNVHALRHVLNRGQGASLQTGTQFALEELNADIIVHFDADGQMQGSDIPNLIRLIELGDVDIVLGSRFIGETSQMPWTRLLTLKLGILFTLIISGIRLSDTHCGFRALSKKAGSEIKITRNRMAHASEILDLIKVKNLKYAECAVDIKYSEETLAKGQSSLGAIVIIKDLLKSKFFDID